jgi:hypothetical protein
MEQNQHHKPNEQEFLQSLNELEEILQGNEETSTTPLETNSETTKIDLAVWEDAVADIEQFFENQQKNNPAET